MEKTEHLKINDVVQLNPETVSKEFAGCFMIIDELKSYGARGFVQVPGGIGQAYYAANWEDMELIGQAVWSIPDGE